MTAKQPFNSDKNNPILFLDYDGVLHPTGGTVAPFEYAPLLVAALEPHSTVSVVLSTSWVPTFGFDDTKAMLPLALQKRIVGTTYDPAYVREKWWQHASRYSAIAQYVRRYRVARWLALDDDDEGWPPELRHHLVRPPKHFGLVYPDTQTELAEKLKRLCA